MATKFVLTPVTKEICGNTAYQIQATRNIPRFGVKAGDLGGFITKEESLSQEGDSWVGRCGYILDNAIVRGDVLVNGMVRNDAVVEGRVFVGYHSVVNGRGTLKGDLQLEGNVCCTLSGDKQFIWGYPM